MAVVYICLFSTTALAAEYSKEAERYGPLELFTEVCEGFFETHRGTYRALDKDGNDVTDKFLEEYQMAYENGQYSIIAEGFDNELSTITWAEDIEKTRNTRDLTISDSVKQIFYIRETVTFGVQKESFELKVAVGGDYEYLNSTGIIIGHDQGSFTTVSYSAASYCSCNVSNVTTNGKLSSNKKSVCFSATFNVTFSFKKLGVETDKKVLGPYTKSLTGFSH